MNDVLELEKAMFTVLYVTSKLMSCLFSPHNNMSNRISCAVKSKMVIYKIVYWYV